MTLWVCSEHGLPEGTCPTCSIVETCPAGKTFTAEEVELALDRAREIARRQERQRIVDRVSYG